MTERHIIPRPARFRHALQVGPLTIGCTEGEWRMLRFLSEGMSTPQIADAEGVEVTSISHRLHRFKRRIADTPYTPERETLTTIRLVADWARQTKQTDWPVPPPKESP